MDKIDKWAWRKYGKLYTDRLNKIVHLWIDDEDPSERTKVQKEFRGDRGFSKAHNSKPKHKDHRRVASRLSMMGRLS